MYYSFVILFFYFFGYLFCIIIRWKNDQIKIKLNESQTPRRCEARVVLSSLCSPEYWHRFDVDVIDANLSCRIYAWRIKVQKHLKRSSSTRLSSHGWQFARTQKVVSILFPNTSCHIIELGMGDAWGMSTICKIPSQKLSTPTKADRAHIDDIRWMKTSYNIVCWL